MILYDTLMSRRRSANWSSRVLGVWQLGQLQHLSHALAPILAGAVSESWFSLVVEDQRERVLFGLSAPVLKPGVHLFANGKTQVCGL